MPACTQCSDGRVCYEEDGRMVIDDCYHCLSTGIIPEETAREDNLESLSMSLASILVRDRQAEAQSDPDGDNWQLRAAENMMTEHEWTLDCIYDQSSKVMKELEKLSPFMQDLIVKMAEVYVTERPPTYKQDNAITLRPPSTPNFPALREIPTEADDILF